MKTLHTGELQQAVDIFVRAFHDDPVLNWISDKPGFLNTFFSLTLPAFMPCGLTYTDDRGLGAAAWLGPDHKLEWPVTPGNLWRMFRACGLGGFSRFALSGLRTTKFHPGEPHYYLFLIGAVPEAQGQGVGTALMSQVLRRCDDENLPAYLENSKRDNLAFYQGHGFQVIDQIHFANTAPPMWLMWREPRPGS